MTKAAHVLSSNFFLTFCCSFYLLLQLYDRINTKVQLKTLTPPSDAIDRAREVLSIIAELGSSTSLELTALLTQPHFKVVDFALFLLCMNAVEFSTLLSNARLTRAVS